MNDKNSIQIKLWNFTQYIITKQNETAAKQLNKQVNHETRLTFVFNC